VVSLVWVTSALWFDTEYLVQALLSIVILSFEFLAMYPFKVARAGVVFLFLERCPWIHRGVGIRGDDGLH